MAKDLYHQIVKEALAKEEWEITHDPYLIPRSNRKPFEVDIGAEKFIAAEKGTEKIAVEVKSFVGTSLTYDFHAAFGQYGIYRFFMTEKDSERHLFLAIPDEVYYTFFVDVDMKNICEHFNLSIIVFNIANIEIVEWIKR